MYIVLRFGHSKANEYRPLLLFYRSILASGTPPYQRSIRKGWKYARTRRYNREFIEVGELKKSTDEKE